tara:strand:+ start:536 stop:709 length:174 start_codon:yes stop_codon:yes gene_type:complete
MQEEVEELSFREHGSCLRKQRMKFNILQRGKDGLKNIQFKEREEKKEKMNNKIKART